jgi:hypothetical protein
MLTEENGRNLKKNLSQCQFVYHKSDIDDCGANPGLRGERPATNRLSHDTAVPTTLGISYRFVNGALNILDTSP